MLIGQRRTLWETNLVNKLDTGALAEIDVQARGGLIIRTEITPIMDYFLNKLQISSQLRETI